MIRLSHLLYLFFFVSTLYSQSYDHDKWNTLPKDIFLEYEAYVSSFDSEDDNDRDGDPDIWSIPEWVAYEIKKSDGTKYDTNNKTWLQNRDLVQRGIAPKDSSYKLEGVNTVDELNSDHRFIRGHMCPRATAYRISSSATRDTYRFVNAVPQLQWQNSEIWEPLEDMCNLWADEYDRIWVICGPIFVNNQPSMWYGQDDELRVAIPEALYKIVIREEGDSVKTISFIIPNILPKEDKNLEEKITTINRIEKLTGLDFMTSLGDQQDQIEGKMGSFDEWRK